MSTSLNLLCYDRTARTTAIQIINSHTAASTPLPASPPNGPIHAQPATTPSASFKPPKLVIDNWSGQTYDFYPWLSSTLNGFNLTGCEDRAKLLLTLQALPPLKRGPFIDIDNWKDFKINLIEEFGSIDIFGRDVNQMFDLLPRYESVQEVAEDLSPKIKTLQSNLKIIQQFHNVEDLHKVALTPTLVQNIMRSLPLEGRSSFNKQFMHFRNLNPGNVRSPATFLFQTHQTLLPLHLQGIRLHSLHPERTVQRQEAELNRDHQNHQRHQYLPFLWMPPFYQSTV